MKTSASNHRTIRMAAISMLTGFTLLAPHARGAVFFPQTNSNQWIASTADSESRIATTPGVVPPDPRRYGANALFAEEAPLSCHLNQWAEWTSSRAGYVLAPVSFEPWNPERGGDAPEEDSPVIEMKDMPATDLHGSASGYGAVIPCFPRAHGMVCRCEAILP